MQIQIKYQTTKGFDKDLKKLSKRYRTLTEDLEVVKKNVIELYHLQHIDSHSTFPIQGMCTEQIMLCKIKKFACKSLKGKGSRSGICVIYAYQPITSSVAFIEIYHKADQSLEDRTRLQAYLNSQI